jgi:hypothetical protein
MESPRLRTPDSIKAYSKLGLCAYDALIVNLLAPRVWGCSPDTLVEHYGAHVTSNHADIGVGTGYFLDRCDFGSPRPRLALVDLQSNCLEYTARRLARYRPRTYVRDVLRPMDAIPGGPFDSIALGGIIHCLAGDLRHKGKVFDTVAPLTSAGTKIFGYTLVNDGVPLRTRRRLVHGFLNHLRVIDNTNDRISDLGRELCARFIDCKLELIGCMALFSAIVPDRASVNERSIHPYGDLHNEQSNPPRTYVRSSTLRSGESVGEGVLL